MHEMTISKVRSKLLLNSPFFGYLVLQLKYVEDTELYYMATNGIELRYNPVKMRQETLENNIGVLVHEVAHCIFEHPTRGIGKNKDVWGNAIDLAVNGFIHHYTDFELPDPHLYEEKYVNWTAEDIYEDLMKNASEEKIASGLSIAAECGEVWDAPGNEAPPQVPGGNPIKLNDKWKQALEGALMVAKEARSLPGNLEELVKKIVEPQLYWADILREFLQSTAKQDFDWNMPNRRFTRQGLYLPRRKSQTVGTVYVAVDTSCSVTKEEFEHINGEINSILEDAGASEVVVIHCDTRIQNVETFSPEDLPLTISFKGRGGTLFKPVFDYIEENVVDLIALIYFTDLEGDTNFPPPPYPVFWIDTNTPNYSPPQPEFGTVIRINP